MQLPTTIEAKIEPIHWVHVKKPLAYDGLASDSHSVLDRSGKLTLLLSSKQKLTAEGAPYLCVTVPGFTGDADTHVSLIRRSLMNGIGVVCATPAWSASTLNMRDAFNVLLSVLKAGPVEIGGLQFVRANSYGAFLTIDWISSLGHQIQKVAFVTPCSAEQLPHAATLIGTPLENDLPTFEVKPVENASVRIVSLSTDRIVPELDPLFLSMSSNTEILKAQSDDHFLAGELKLASADVADWFAEGL